MKAAAWGDEGTTEFDEVERYRALLQKTSVDIDRADADLDDKAYVKDDGEVAGTQMEGYPDFGHNMLQYWNFRPGCECLSPPSDMNLIDCQISTSTTVNLPPSPEISI